jgi:hypothetical protein
MQNPRPYREKNFYTPQLLRLSSFVIVFLITIALIGVIEYAVIKLPHAAKTNHVDPKVVISSLLHKRQTNLSVPTTIITASPSPDAYVATTAPNANYATTTAGGGEIGASATSTPGESAPATAYVQTTIPNVNQPPPPTTVLGAYVQTTIPNGNQPTTPAVSTTTTISQSYVTALRQTTNPNSYVTETQVPTTFITSILSAMMTTITNGVGTTYTTLVSSTSVGMAAVQTGNNNKGSNQNVYRAWQTFIPSYFALILAVLYRQYWTAICSQTKLIEPFILLAQPNRATSFNALTTFYLSSSLLPDPFLAFIRHHWFILWTSLVYFAVGFLGPLSSELMFLDTNYPNCPHQTGNSVNPCWPPLLSIDPGVARPIQGLLIYVAIMTLTIMILIFRVSTGTYSDPSSIASIASLIHHPNVIDDFRSFHAEATTSEILQYLGDKKYKLDEYLRPDGVWRYGIVPAVPTLHTFIAKKPLIVQRPRRRKWNILSALSDLLFMILLIALLGVVAAYYKDGKSDGFNKFINSRTFGPRFLLTGTGTLIAINWKRLERGKLILFIFKSF